MSYIRCLNNPEQLYVFGDGIETWFSGTQCDRSYLLSVPSDEVDRFFLAMHKWEKSNWIDVDIPFSLGDISVAECWIPNGKKTYQGDRCEDLKIKLTLKSDCPDLVMWGVTWEYLKNSFYDHLIRPPWYIRFLKKLKFWS